MKCLAHITLKFLARKALRFRSSFTLVGGTENSLAVCFVSRIFAPLRLSSKLGKPGVRTKRSDMDVLVSPIITDQPMAKACALIHGGDRHGIGRNFDT